MMFVSGDWFALTVNDPQDLIKVATSGGGVRNGQTDDLLGINDEHRSDGEGNALGITVAGVLVVQHVVQGGDITRLVGDLEITMNTPLSNVAEVLRLTIG